MIDRDNGKVRANNICTPHESKGNSVNHCDEVTTMMFEVEELCRCFFDTVAGKPRSQTGEDFGRNF